MKYKVIKRIVYSEIFEVEAESKKEAEDIAMQEECGELMYDDTVQECIVEEIG